MKLEINLESIKKSAKALANFGPFIAALVMLGAIGFCAWRMSTALNVVPTADAIDAEKTAQSAAKITFDVKTIDSLNNLVDVPTTIDTSSVGKQNPFAP